MKIEKIVLMTLLLTVVHGLLPYSYGKVGCIDKNTLMRGEGVLRGKYDFKQSYENGAIKCFFKISDSNVVRSDFTISDFENLKNEARRVASSSAKAFCVKGFQQQMMIGSFFSEGKGWIKPGTFCFIKKDLIPEEAPADTEENVNQVCRALGYSNEECDIK